VCQYVLLPMPTLLNKLCNSVNLYGDPIQDCLNHLYSLIWQLSLSLQSSVLQRESVRMFLVRVVGVTERIVFPHSCVLVVRGGVTIIWKLHGPFSFQSKRGRRWGCYSSPSPSSCTMLLMSTSHVILPTYSRCCALQVGVVLYYTIDNTYLIVLSLPAQ